MLTMISTVQSNPCWIKLTFLTFKDAALDFNRYFNLVTFKSSVFFRLAVYLILPQTTLIHYRKLLIIIVHAPCTIIHFEIIPWLQ